MRARWQIEQACRSSQLPSNPLSPTLEVALEYPVRTSQQTVRQSTAARTFVRNFNIMLKFVRLYGFDHTRTGEQIEKTWAELRAALAGESDGDILLAASGNQLLLNGAPLGNSGADRTLAHLMTSIGLSSLHFSSQITREDFDKFVRNFPSGRGAAALLAEKYKRNMEGVTGVRLNEICFVPADSAAVSLDLAARITRDVLGGTGAEDSTSWFNNPEKLLQLIAAAEGSTGSGSDNGGSGERRRGGGGDGRGSGEEPGGGNGSGGPGGGSGTGGFGGGTGGGFSSVAGYGGQGSAAGGTGSPSGEVGGPEGAGGFGASGAGSGLGPGTGSGMGSGTGSGGSDGGRVAKRPRGAPSDFWVEVKAAMRGLQVASGPLVTPEQEDVCKLLRLLRQLAPNYEEQKESLEPAAFQSRLATFPVGTRVRFNDALLALASQVQGQPHDKSFLVRLAEHMAIRFAVETYERGDVQVTAVQALLERMGTEIAALRDILGRHEAKLKGAGIAVSSHEDQLDQQFWTALPDATKRSLLLSAEAWFVPPRHVLEYAREQQKFGDHDASRNILSNYLKGVESENAEARRKTFSGLCDLAECYGEEDALLGDAIGRVGARINAEQDRELRSLASAAFVRLGQEGAARRNYSVLQQVLNSLDRLGSEAPSMIAGLHQRIGLEDRLSEFLEDALRVRKIPEGLVEILQRLPRAGAKQLAKRFGQAQFREDCDLLLTLFHSLGPEATACLRDSVNEAAPLEAVESVGLLSRVDPAQLEYALRVRLRECPRSIHDQVVRRIAYADSEERGRLLAALFDSLEPLIRPLALDEIGMSGDTSVVPWLLQLAENEKGENELVRLKAIEAIGRLRVREVAPILQKILEAKHMFRWLHPPEVRIVAAQTLAKVDPAAWEKLAARADLSPAQLSSPALDTEVDASGVRQRRYARTRFTQPLIAATTNLRKNSALQVHSLNLGGGAASVDRHFPAGTILALRITVGMRSVQVQVLVRESPSGIVNFEIVEISLADRSRLRQILSEVGSAPPPSSAKNRVRRRPPQRAKR
jgi:hypothetical protein